MNRLFWLGALTYAVSTSGFGQPMESSSHFATFSVETKQTAIEQLKYARRILVSVTRTPPGWSRVELVSQADVALRQVHERWPSDAQNVTQSFVLRVRLLAAENMPAEAIRASAEAEENAAVKESSIAIVRAIAGSAHAALGHTAEASVAFASATRGSAFERLSAEDKLDVLNRASLFYEQVHRYRDASEAIRHAARYSKSEVHRMGMLLRSVEMNERLGDRAEARADLAACNESDKRARQQTVSPDEAAALAAFEAAAARHRKRAND